MYKKEAVKGYTQHIRNYDYEVVCGMGDAVFPAEFEIPRENTGTIKNQFNIGACGAEVIAQIAESFYKEEMSEGHIYGTYRTHNGRGLYMEKAMDFWVSIGTLPKKYFDILKEMPEMKAVIDKFPDFKELAEKHRLKAYAAINYANTEKKDNAIKEALTKTNRGLVAISNNYFAETHCIMLTGWNDKANRYKFKNSVGEGFGDKGFSEIPKNQVNAVYVPFFEDITLPFEDVKGSDWFFDAVKSMYFAGLMNGTTDKTFEPDRALTRAEMATLTNRITKLIDERFDILNRVITEKIDG